MLQRWLLSAGMLAAVFRISVAEAAEPSACRAVSRANLIACVMGASLEARAAHAGVQAAEGRVLAARPWFAAPPSLALSTARRVSGDQADVNWTATVGVELQLAGQRAARREAASAEREARLKAGEVDARATALVAWRAYFDVLQSAETVALVERLAAGAKRVSDAARAFAERGAAAGAEADLAEALYLRVNQRYIAAERDAELTRVELADLLGLASTRELSVQGTLTPLPLAEGAGVAPGSSPKAAALDAESRAFAAQADAERRARVPNPTVSVFAQRDGFNERVMGVGLALPLPLPEPLGRLRAGEIAENEALSRRAHLLAERARRSARSQILEALARYEAAKRSVAAYTPERLQRAQATLTSLAVAVESGRMGVRDALILQDPLLEQLLSDIDARHALCVASAELLLALNVRLEEGAGR